jgi:TPR repeat protein
MTLTTALVGAVWLHTVILSEALATPNTSDVSQPAPLEITTDTVQTNAQADADYQQAITLLEQGKRAEAAGFLEQAARRGILMAQYRLGLMYAQGDGMDRDLSLALRWLRAAAPHYAPAVEPLQKVRYELRTAYTDEFDRTWTSAQAGDALSMFKLALMFEEGVGTVPNHTRALEWLQKAAHANVADAQARLGTLYFTGEQLPQDFQQAEHWLTQAASLGEPVSMALLGTLYRDAKGVKRNVITAMQWFILSAYHGNTQALSSLDELVRWHSTPIQQEAAQHAALMWLLQQRGISSPPESIPAPPPTNPEENTADPRHEHNLDTDL